MMITSGANPRVKRLVNLQKKRKLRDAEGVFITEGVRMFREVPPERLEEVWASESFYQKGQPVISQILKDTKVNLEIVPDAVYERISDTMTPQGILCVVKQASYGVREMADQAMPMLLVLDNLQDPGNLGTIVRTAEGAGVTGILLSQGCVDIYNPKTIRSTMGSVYRMPFCYAEDLPSELHLLKSRGIQLYAAHLKGKASYDKEDYTKPCAFLIGNEGNGLRAEIAGMADVYVHIPMKGQVESLNAAVAASLLTFEAARQRRA